MRQRGFGMVELLLGVTVAIVAGAGVFVLAKQADVHADVRQEQAHAQEISEAIAGAYLAASDYSTLSTATAAGVLNTTLQGNSFTSSFGAALTVRPATTHAANDSFELVYTGLSSTQCAGLASAMKDRTRGIRIGSNSSIQALDGTVADESAIATQCAALSPTESLALRFYTDKNTYAASTMDACTCSPQVDKQSLACPSGQVGSITQTRTGDCSGGTPACPSQAWSSWVTTTNTCGSAGAPVAPQAPTSPSTPAACTPRVETRPGTCPSGQVGAVLQQRTTDCATGTWNAWVDVSSSCSTAPATAACTPQVGPIEVGACPSGMGGQVLSQRSATCDAAGNLVWGPLQTVSSTCTASCALNGTCCTPRRERQTVGQGCAQGSYGYTTVSQVLNYTCASATATPTAWGGWTNDESTRSGACSTCPADSTVSNTQWVSRSNTTCPAGQTGTNTWEAEQAQTVATTYNCNHAANVNAPVATVTPGAWADTGATRNLASTCKATGGPGLPGGKCGDTCNISGGVGLGWLDDSGACVKAKPMCEGGSGPGGGLHFCADTGDGNGGWVQDGVACFSPTDP